MNQKTTIFNCSECLKTFISTEDSISGCEHSQTARVKILESALQMTLDKCDAIRDGCSLKVGVALQQLENHHRKVLGSK